MPRIGRVVIPDVLYGEGFRSSEFIKSIEEKTGRLFSLKKVGKPKKSNKWGRCPLVSGREKKECGKKEKMEYMYQNYQPKNDKKSANHTCIYTVFM